MRYRMTERANNMAVGSWRGASGGLGFSSSLWHLFTGREPGTSSEISAILTSTLEVLRAYGDSVTVRGKELVKTIKN